jgi:hypothetical protein
MECPLSKVVFADLHGKTIRAIRRIYFASVLDDIEPLVSSRHILPSSCCRSTDTAQTTDQRLARRIIISLHPLDLDLAIYPGHRVNTDSSVHLSRSEGMAHRMRNSTIADVK